MATPSSSARGPSASQPPATASVTKFRCLFTHDLRRKSKRWQDGYLRYHAFNKRIMVFDEQGNFIGDHHWRSVDEVQDGDELELDKGVLIEVGERMGTTQTDLTNLFEKRKSSQGSPASRNQTPQASQSTHTSTPVRPSGSQSFRSLNDLLGIRKTPIGHLVSPYEERHPPRPSNTPERPEPVPKRQKVAAPRSPAVNNPRSQTDVVDLTGPERGSSGTNERNVGTPREHPKPQNGMSHMPPPEKPKKDTAPRSQRADPPAPKPPPPQISKPPTSRPPKVATPAPVKDPPPQQPPKHDVPSRHVPEISDDDWEAPVKTMRMTMQKPRKKLMYSALLPTEKSQKTSPGPSIPPSEKRSQSTPKTAESQSTRTPAPAIDSTNLEFAPSDSTQFILEEMMDGPNSQPEPNRPHNSAKDTRIKAGTNQPLSSLQKIPTRRLLDAPLRKSLSDPTALTARPMRPTLTRSALSTADEQDEPPEEGPWTSEALDLFDFWPPGRPKPVS